MSLDAIKQVTRAENEQEQKRAAQAVVARKMISDTEQYGRELLDRVYAEAKIQNAELLAQAESEAERESADILLKADQDCQTLKTAARARMNDAQALIVGRVVAQ